MFERLKPGNETTADGGGNMMFRQETVSTEENYIS